MRVAWFLTNLRGGGAERLPLVLFRGLAHSRLQLVLLKDWVEHALPGGLSPPRTLSPREGSLWAHAGAILSGATRAAREADVVVGGMEWAASMVGALAAMRARKPFVAIVHPDLHEFRRHQHVPHLAWLGQRWAMRRAARVIAVSEGAARSCLALGVPQARIVRLPNPHPAWADAVAAHRAAPVAGPMRLLTVGSLHRVKGSDLVPAIAERAGEAIASWTLVGDGPGRAGIEAELNERGLSSRVRVVGFEQDPSRHYESADLHVLPSRAEGLPLSLLEAMASGVPVVASRCGEGVEALLDTTPPAGVLTEVGDGAAMAAAIVALAADPARRAALAAEARRRVQAFAPDTVAARYDSLFADVLE